MNKKIFIMPIAICAMGLASCNGASNKGLTRHTFKEIKPEEAISIIKGLDTQQWKDGVVDSTVTMQEKKASINAYNEFNLKSNYKNACFEEKLTKVIKGNWDQDTKTAVFSNSTTEINVDEPGTSTNINQVTGFKTIDSDSYAFSEMAGAKIKYKTTVINQDFNTNCLLYLANQDNRLDMIDFVGNVFHPDYQKIHIALDLFGGYNSSYSIRQIFIYNGLLERFIEKNATVSYGSNDKKSVMIGIKGTLSYEDFIYVIQNVKPTASTKYEGNVEVDYFFGLEDCFVTQFETITKYKDVKTIYEYGGQSHTSAITNGEVYSKIDVNYKSGTSVNVNLDDYVSED